MNGPNVPNALFCGLQPSSHYCLSNETGSGYIGWMVSKSITTNIGRNNSCVFLDTDMYADNDLNINYELRLCLYTITIVIIVGH